ncbi:hypothetical protein [Bradyrhizobium vignae]|nr:hypothetical protein [Bradyrhizobium vignae]
MPHKDAGMRIAFGAMAFHQHDLIPWRLAEVMARSADIAITL